jgi:hypothetical protein
MKRGLTMGVIELLIPQPCPFQLVRVGGTSDGAYLIPDDLAGIDACFSPGVNNFKNFEDELANQYGIKCHMCDFSSDPSRFRTPLVEGMQTFKKKWLDINGNSDSVSLEEWIDEYSPVASKDLILQIDIEGAEYRNLLASPDSTLKRFRIIVIELHRLGAFKNPELLSKEVEPLLRKLHETHICVHAHPNNCCGDFIDGETGLNIPNIIEVTLLRRDRFEGDSSRFYQPKLPHPFDILYNVRYRPPIHLNENWLSTKMRSLDSEIKALNADLDYANWDRKQAIVKNSVESEELVKLHRLSSINLINAKSESVIQSNVDLALFTEGGNDLALGRNYFLSKAYGPYPIEGIVREVPKFFFHTAVEKNQSITIDLGDKRILNYLVIGNRIDAFQDRARCLFCIVHDKKEYSKQDVLPVVVADEFLKPNGAKSITPLFAKQGRYLTIFSPINTALHFSSVRLY